jgi:hypothetical protein
MRADRMVAVMVAAATLWAPGVAWADPLAGQVTDAITGTPIMGAEIEVLGAGVRAVTDAEGRWRVELPRGEYEIGVKAAVAGEVQESRLVRQYVPQIKRADAYFYSTYFQDRGVAPRAEPVGLPAGSGRLPVGGPTSLPLPGNPSAQGWSARALTIPQTLPTKIRVGRRERPTEGCSNNPIVAIEEVPLDDYTRGVLPPEIGVFRSLSGAVEVYKTFALAAKSYGLWFVLTYGETNRRTVSNPLPPNNFTWFHIDDTACNQRYSDQRLTITTEASDAVAGMILVKKGEPNTLDKLEYAASCAKHGTLPEYGSVSSLVPDVPMTRPCVGSWCGHDTCAGHEDNPSVPGTDRCLVRGICQWGAAGHGMDGRSYQWMIAHYQPNLEIRDVNAAPSVAVTGYVYTDPANIMGTGVADAQVMLSTGDAVNTDAQGKFLFPTVDLSLMKVSLTASKQGYVSATREKPLVAGEANWASIQITREGEPAPDMGGGMDPDPGAPDMDAPTEDMGAGEADLGGGGSADMAAGLPPGTQFGPLLTESQGIDGGCAAGAGPAASLPVWLLLVGGAWRRRMRV